MPHLSAIGVRVAVVAAAALLVSPLSIYADAAAMYRGNLARTGVIVGESAQFQGRFKWQQRVGDPNVAGVYGDLILPSPAVAEGVVYFGNQKGMFYALDAKTGVEKWRQDFGVPVRSSPAVVNGTVYFGCHDKHVYALDAVTGGLKWKYKTGGLVRSSPAVWEREEYHEVVVGQLLVGSQDGYLYCLDPKDGRLLWRFKTGGPVFSSPALSEDGATVYVGSNDGNLYAVDAANGRERWRFKTDYWITAAPAVAGSLVFVGSWDGTFHAVDAATGELKWSRPMPEISGRYIIASPAVTKDSVYIAYRGDVRNGDGSHVYALVPVTGEELWRQPVAASIEASPTLVGNTLLVADMTGFLRGLDRRTGEERWNVRIGGRREIISTPTVAAGTIYFGDLNGNLNAVE